MLEQPDFADGRFHTTYLDEVLAQRNGQPFARSSPVVEDLAAIAAVVRNALEPGRAAPSHSNGSNDANGRGEELSRRWKAQARIEALRGAPGD